MAKNQWIAFVLGSFVGLILMGTSAYATGAPTIYDQDAYLTPLLRSSDNGGIFSRVISDRLVVLRRGSRQLQFRMLNEEIDRLERSYAHVLRDASFLDNDAAYIERTIQYTETPWHRRPAYDAGSPYPYQTVAELDAAKAKAAALRGKAAQIRVDAKAGVRASVASILKRSGLKFVKGTARLAGPLGLAVVAIGTLPQIARAQNPAGAAVDKVIEIATNGSLTGRQDAKDQAHALMNVRQSIQTVLENSRATKGTLPTAGSAQVLPTWVISGAADGI